MKRPFLVIGFSMLVTFLIVTNITHKMTIVLLTGAVVIFLCFLVIKILRKHISVILALVGVITFVVSFICTEKYYIDEMKGFEKEQNLTGVVCNMPTSSDYAFTYIVKPDGKNYKIRFVTESNAFLREGDYVQMSLIGYNEYEESQFFEHALSSKIYFTFFESDKCKIVKTGDNNQFYRSIGTFKSTFSDIIMNYLPGQNGIIATAMTIGDNSKIDDTTINHFNNSGTSHLLVISGLHLTLWSFGVMKFLNRFSKSRKFSHIIGLLCLFAFSSVTGFTVSVIRAGTMVGAILISRFFRRDADNLNSIGAAVTFILTGNPFAPFSVSLWLTVLSTVGIIAYSGKIEGWVREKLNNKPISKLPFYHSVLTSFAISFSVTVFTLPVFVYKLKMMPILSVFANLIMVTPAMLMMVLTVAGSIFHIFPLKVFSRICFFVVGTIGKLLCFTAEKIGVSDWSTISLNHKYYKYFLFLLLIGISVTLILKKYKIDILKHISVALTIIFCIVAVYCTHYEYSTPSVEVLFTSSEPIITVFSENKSVLIGVQEKKNVTAIRNMLRKHNEKQLDYIVVTEKKQETPSQLIYLYKNFDNAKTLYNDDVIEIFKEDSEGYVSHLSLSEKVNINCIDKNIIEIDTGNKSILSVECKKIEKIYESKKNYDIIILHGKKSYEFEEDLKDKFEFSQIIISEDGKSVSIT